MKKQKLYFTIMFILSIVCIAGIWHGRWVKWDEGCATTKDFVAQTIASAVLIVSLIVGFVFVLRLFPKKMDELDRENSTENKD